jgi:hypothetical protein
MNPMNPIISCARGRLLRIYISDFGSEVSLLANVSAEKPRKDPQTRHHYELLFCSILNPPPNASVLLGPLPRSNACCPPPPDRACGSGSLR